MSTIKQNNTTDGSSTMTTMAEPIPDRTLTDERDDATIDGRTTITDGQTTDVDGQTTVTTMTTADERVMRAATTATESTLAAFEAVGEATGGESSAAPMSSAPGTPLFPRRGYESATDSLPDTSGRTRTGLRSQASDGAGAGHAVGLGAQRKRVVGRKRATVINDEEDESQASICDGEVMSITSGDDDSSMASASGVSRRKGTKRNRDGGKDKVGGAGSKGKIGEEDQEDKKRKRKKEGKGRETPEEEEERVGPTGEPKGVVGHVFENMTSAVLGGAMAEWANQIEDMRSKSKNLHGKFSGAIKNLLVKIKEGTALLVVRSEAVGDPHFLRMRNTELTTRMKEVEKENARLKEQVRKTSPGADSPSRKKKVEKRMTMAASDGAENEAAKREKIAPISAGREEFPPLPQRTPRNWTRESIPQRASPPVVQQYADTEDTEAESCLTQQINLLVAARRLERERRRKGQDRTWVGGQDNRTGTEERKRTEEVHGGGGKTGPRIRSDVQLVPPMENLPVEESTPAVSASEAEWTVATGGRRGKNRERRAMLPPPPPTGGPQASERQIGRGGVDRYVSPPQRPSGQRALGVRLPKPPRTSAVTITGRAEGFSYATALKGAREKINLEALGIQISRVRKAVNGGLLIEIPGEGSKLKAEELTARLRDVLGDSAAVSCPTKRREIRVIGFDESVTQNEIVDVLSNMGDCPGDEIKVGAIRTMSNGLGAVWAQLPMTAAVRVADAGRARIGWTMARVELLRVRPLQCYRCWAYGHVQGVCRNAADRRGACFNCGQHGHNASGCRNPALCMVCSDQGLNASHRLGGPRCLAQTQPGKTSDRRPATTISDNVQMPTDQSQ